MFQEVKYYFLKCKYPNYNFFVYKACSSIWREWEGVKKRSLSPSPFRPPVPQKTLSVMVLTQTERHLHSVQHSCTKRLFVLFLPWSKLLTRIFFFLCQLLCCYDYSAFDVIPGFFEAKLALHAQCCNLQYWGTNKVA